MRNVKGFRRAKRVRFLLASNLLSSYNHVAPEAARGNCLPSDQCSGHGNTFSGQWDPGTAARNSDESFDRVSADSVTYSLLP